jgi:arylsulfatase A-like enzyme
MNFQAVSVGQKLINPTSGKGGYTDGAGDPTSNMLNQIEFVDDAVGQMVAALNTAGLSASTTIIITAKHGQSPVDPSLFFPIPGHAPLNNGISPSTILWNNGHNSLLAQTDCEFAGVHCAKGVGGGLGPTEDDISQIWLKDSSKTAEAVEMLQANAATAGISQIFYGPSVTNNFYSSETASRTPDIIIQPRVGVVYTGSNKKQAEHGGFAHDDTNVMLLVSNPSMTQSTNYQFVETKQVAPTILKILGLDPNALDAVKMEGTAVLPGSF